MQWNTSLSTLRAVLAMLYRTPQDARRITDDVGLNPSFITFDNKASNNWHNILVEAVKQNRLDGMIQVVRHEYGENAQLAQAYQAYLDTITQISPASPSGRSSTHAPQATPGAMQPIKILFLAANPRDIEPLKLDEEVRAIDQALRQSQFRDRFDMKQHWAVRYSDLQAVMLRHQPDIVHFSGHGSAAGEIVLQDDSGANHPVSVRALSALFSILKDNIRCVVLNACYSEQQAQAIAQHIEVVIGMSQNMSDQASIGFASAFYQALGYGRSVQTAFDLGRIQLDLANLDAQDTPKLLAPNSNPTQIVFATETQAQHPGSGPGSGKYHINIGTAQGVAIGDHAQVTQTFGGEQASHSASSPSDTDTVTEQRTALQRLLAQHQSNLRLLQSKKAVYAAGEEPLSLLNQIDHEGREISRIQAQLQR
jgi:hypothetical protein